MSNQTFFTSDLHVFHKKIVQFTNRGLETSQENHTEWLRDVWNSQVNAGDLVYHLGDFSFGKYQETADFLKSLNGQKILIKGNHDRVKMLDQLVSDGLISAWYDYKEIKIGDQYIVLFHFPIMSWHRQGHGSWHLHGHCHGNLKEDMNRGKMLDVGIDNAYTEYSDYFLFDFEGVSQHMSAKSFYLADHHRENI